MNDLPYREWMKFQKSFFRHRSDQSLLKECIEFFTKSVWPDGRESRSLVVGFDVFDQQSISRPRVVENIPVCDSLVQIVNILKSCAEEGKKFDFIIADLRRHFDDTKKLEAFCGGLSDDLFRSLRALLYDDRYCGIVVETGADGGAGFPIPWAVAQVSRNHLRLRDEKIGLVEETGRLYYCLFMQAKEDERCGYALTTADFRVASCSKTVPGWIIPKPPPRKKNEILHPAKYPETLVEEFIELFTQPGERVFDPMVGTGSTIIAALRKGRNGFGMDLIPSFVEIAAKRICEESVKSDLFSESSRQAEGKVIQGDATRLDEIPDIADKKFEYAITSPPYWSMLSNPGSENQEERRRKNLPLVYSEDKDDLGNIGDYDQFLKILETVYNSIAAKIASGRTLTVVVKNVKRNHVLYPLAWDLAARLCKANGKYEYLGTTFWCQDDVGLKPFAVGIHWVSNILHHYCLHFRRL